MITQAEGKGIPIIFSAPMVRALLDGRKTQTRRLAWRDLDVPDDWVPECAPSPWQRVKDGDRLWVRENHRLTDCECIEACRGWGHVWYDADESGYRAVSSNKCRPSIHMPRWASRLTLIVTATRIDRLQEISHDDIVQEGVSGDGGPGLPGAFMTLWEKLHGPDSWHANPEVVAITFKPILANIDQLQDQPA